jgi:peptide/nickel transport system permease protein
MAKIDIKNTFFGKTKLQFKSIMILLVTSGFAILVLFALLPAFIATHDPLAQDVNAILLPPSGEHLMGTDWAGRDIFSRIVYGTRISLYIGILSITFASVFGSITGISSAYIGGYTDLIIQRIVDTILGIPSIVIALIIIVSFGSSANSIAFAISMAITPQIIRLARANTISIKNNLYIDAIELIGAKPSRIIFKHFMPNIAPVMLSQISGYFGVAIVAESTLSFLGLGVPPPDSSWGRMIQEGSAQYMETAPWTTLFPGIVMSMTVVFSAILGDAIGDLLNKKHR